MNDPVVEAQSLISATRQVHVKRRLIQFMQSIDVSILPVRYQRNQRKGSKCCLLMVRFFELLFFLCSLLEAAIASIPSWSFRIVVQYDTISVLE